MLRPSAASTKHSSLYPGVNENINNNNSSNGSADVSVEKVKYSKHLKTKLSSHSIILCITSFVFGMIVRNNILLMHNKEATTRSFQQQQSQVRNLVEPIITASSSSSSESAVFQSILNRAILHQQHCNSLGLTEPSDYFITTKYNNHTAHLPRNGIINAIQSYKPSPTEYPYQCTIPPENECLETHFTVVFMAYNPDRLKKMFNQIKIFLSSPDFKQLVAEVIVVWNGERHVDETDLGKELVEFSKTYPVRISYPLKAGFTNDLLNRYHPRLHVKTKAIMYYDDDGPFYSYKATLAGFELWKRNSNAQIGAMARKLDLSPRALDESNAVLNGPGDRYFISQCPGDELDYNYREFANFGARMVLPSGSFLHSNYLCFIWHPIFDEIRRYVRSHPVNPDDGTVSTIVSQLAGRAPKVYPRRVNEASPEDEQEQ